jgi:hypothetical protein
MAEIKKINTDLQIEAGLLDGDGNSGTANQILISTGTGVDWVDGSGSSVIGGPYLPLSAGSSYPLTGDLYLDDGSGASPSLYFKNQSDNFWRYLMESGGSFSIKEGTSTRLTFQAGGNVGIGTTSPSSRLTVQAAGSQTTQRAITIFHNNTLAGGYASIGAQYTVTNGYIDSEIRFGSETLNGACSFMSFATGCNNTITQGSNSERMRIDSSGNVGIGTTIPSTKLHLADSSDVYLTLESTSETTPEEVAVKYSNSATGVYNWWEGLNQSANWSLGYGASFSGSNTKLLVDTSGNVGIGTTAPLEPLSVFAGTNESVYDVLGVYNSVTGTSAVGKGAAIRIGKDVDGDYSTKIATIYEDNNPSFLQPAMAFFTMRDTYLKGSEVERMRISSGGNVGIGTTSPSQKLHINNSTASSASYAKFSNAQTGTTTADGFDVGVNTGTEAIIWQRENSNLLFATNNTERIRITSGGNVGIGTTNPGADLSVQGKAVFFHSDVSSSATPSYAQVEIQKDDADANWSYLAFHEIGSIAWQQGILDNKFVIASTGGAAKTSTDVERLTIDAYGNVGIGDTSPTQISANTFSLSVNSSRTDLSGGLISKANGTVKHQQYWDTSGYNFSLAANSGNFKFIGGNVGIGTTSPTFLLQVQGTPPVNNGALINARNSAATATNTTFGGIYFNSSPGNDFSIGKSNVNTVTTLSFRNGNNGVSLMDITPSGNVGIGTTSPNDKLNVHDSSASANLGIKITRGSQTHGLRLGVNDSHAFLWTDQNQDLVFATNNSQRVTILKGGNVGIGTTSPGAKLDVVVSNVSVTPNGNSSAVFRQNANNYISILSGTNNEGGVLFGNSNDAADGWIAYQNGSGNQFITFGTANSEKMRIKSNGDVRFNSNSHTPYIQLVNSGRTPGNPGYSFNNDENTGMFQPAGVADTIAFSTAGAERIRINSSGNVGIGTTSPAVQLELGDNTADEKLRLTGAASGKPLMTFYNTTTKIGQIASSSVGITVTSLGSGNMSFENGGNTRLVIENGGNVGIGTTSPSAKLHVKDTSLSGTLAYFEASASAQGTTNVRVDCLQYGTGIAFFRDGSLGGGACSFRNDSGTQVGSINIGTSSTLYSTSSDYRLKENLTLITDGIDRLKQLKPKRFNFIGETQIVDGFVAHEAKEVVPESVTGEKDEVLPNGDPVYQGIDQAKIVPLLTAALQEAVAKIEDLENRIKTLENK